MFGNAIERGSIDWRRMARPERFELPTSWFVAMRSIQLSYGRAAGTYLRGIVDPLGNGRPRAGPRMVARAASGSKRSWSRVAEPEIGLSSGDYNRTFVICTITGSASSTHAARTRSRPVYHFG